MSSSIGSLASFESMAVSMNWPNSHAPLRKAIEWIILQMPGVRCSADRLITAALNAVGGVDGSDDIMAVDTALINTAFSKCGKVINAPFMAMGLEEDVAAAEEEDDNNNGEEMEEELEEEEWRGKEALGARIGA